MAVRYLLRPFDLWWRYFPQLAALYLLGWLGRKGAIELAAYVGWDNDVWASLIMPFAGLARLGSYVAMFLVLRPAIPALAALPRRAARSVDVFANNHRAVLPQSGDHTEVDLSRFRRRESAFQLVDEPRALDGEGELAVAELFAWLERGDLLVHGVEATERRRSHQGKEKEHALHLGQLQTRQPLRHPIGRLWRHGGLAHVAGW